MVREDGALQAPALLLIEVSRVKIRPVRFRLVAEDHTQLPIHMHRRPHLTSKRYQPRPRLGGTVRPKPRLGETGL
jgi:hypothetical protein